MAQANLESLSTAAGDAFTKVATHFGEDQISVNTSFFTNLVSLSMRAMPWRRWVLVPTLCMCLPARLQITICYDYSCKISTKMPYSGQRAQLLKAEQHRLCADALTEACTHALDRLISPAARTL